jgi:hypothetical protein
MSMFASASACAAMLGFGISGTIFSCTRSVCAGVEADTGAEGIGRTGATNFTATGVVAEAAGCTSSCVPIGAKFDSGLLGGTDAGATDVGVTGVNAAGAEARGGGAATGARGGAGATVDGKVAGVGETF